MTRLVLFALSAGLVGCAVESPVCEPDEEDCGGDPGTDDGKADGATLAGNTAQMNDLTILMPLATTQASFAAYLPATAKGARGALLAKTPYTSQFPDPHGGGVGSDVGMTYADLRVVAIRFDPCFAQVGPITDPATCDNQIRLVFQDLSFSGGKTSAIDGAVHAFYRVDRAELTKAIREVIDLRRANGQTHTLGPLAPHPLIAKQGQAGAFAQGLAKIVLAHCGADNLIRFTHFQSSNLQTVWAFAGFDLAPSAVSPMVVPTLPGKATSGSFFAGFAAPIAGGFTPETTSADDVAVLVNAATAKQAARATAQAALDAALRIENPDFHSPNTIDCASCHVAQAARQLVGEDVLHLVGDASDAFVADPKFVSKANLKETTSSRGQSFNVHMLSYKNGDLMIGQRVINETAAVVAYVNGVIRP